MEKAGLLDYAIAPLTWLERSRGWKRRGLIALYAVVALVCGVFGWREVSLWGLPNMGEPFDLAKAGTVEVPDLDNAMLYYQGAAARLTRADLPKYRTDSKAWDVTDWSKLDPAVRLWAEDNRAVLDHWLRGTECRDSLVAQPRLLTISTLLSTPQSLRDFARLATLEASRLEGAGDFAGTWRLYRGVLRSSRHCGMHGVAIQRWIGLAILRKVRPRIEAWAERPGVTSAMLRRAAADVAECAAMTPPVSDAVRCEYFASLDSLAHPEFWKNFDMEGMEGSGNWYNHVSFLPPARHFLLREPERSRRILRLTTAGLLAQCDRPRAVRPKLVSDKYMIYQVDAETPPALRAIAPEELRKWADGSVLSTVAFSFDLLQTNLDFEPALFDGMVLKLAELAYQLDHGRPPKTYADLLGPYLKALPEGIEPGDAVSAGSAEPEPK